MRYLCKASCSRHLIRNSARSAAVSVRSCRRTTTTRVTLGGGREGAWATFRQTLDRALGSTLMGEDIMDARGARKSDRQHPGPADIRP